MEATLSTQLKTDHQSYPTPEKGIPPTAQLNDNSYSVRETESEKNLSFNALHLADKNAHENLVRLLIKEYELDVKEFKECNSDGFGDHHKSAESSHDSLARPRT